MALVFLNVQIIKLIILNCQISDSRLSSLILRYKVVRVFFVLKLRGFSLFEYLFRDFFLDRWALHRALHILLDWHR